MDSDGLGAGRENDAAGTIRRSRAIEGDHGPRLDDTRRPRSLDAYALQMSPSWPRLHPPTRSRSSRTASGLIRGSSMTGAQSNRRSASVRSVNNSAQRDMLEGGDRPKANEDEDENNTLDAIAGSSSDGSRESSVVEPQTKAAMQQQIENIRPAGPSGSTNDSRGPDTMAVQGPQHPYALYPQNTIEDAAPALPPLSIPVGFLGLQQPYQQQTGARVDESQDIVGPLGHVEELPPYTRYPTHQLPGTSSERPSPPVVVPSSDNDHPAPESAVSPLSPPDPLQQTPSTRSLASDNSRRGLQGQQSGSSEDQAVINEKSRPLKRRCCNGKVPVWVLLVVVALCLLLFGTLLGVMMRNRNHKRALKAAAAAAATSSTTAPVP